MTTHIDPSVTPDDASPETIARNAIDGTERMTPEQAREVARAYLQLRANLTAYADVHWAFVRNSTVESDRERVFDSKCIALTLYRKLGIHM